MHGWPGATFTCSRRKMPSGDTSSGRKGSATPDYAVIAAFAATRPDTAGPRAGVDRADPAWPALCPIGLRAALDRDPATPWMTRRACPCGCGDEALARMGSGALLSRDGPTSLSRPLCVPALRPPMPSSSTTTTGPLAGPKSDGLVALNDALQRKGVPIDGLAFSPTCIWSRREPGLVGIQYNPRRPRAASTCISPRSMFGWPTCGWADRAPTGPGQRGVPTGAACRGAGGTHVAFWGVTDRYSWIDAAIGPDDPPLWDDHANPSRYTSRFVMPWPVALAGCDADLSGSGSSLDASTQLGPARAGRDRRRTRSSCGSARRPGMGRSSMARLAEGCRIACVSRRSTAGTPLKLTLRVVDGAGTRFMTVAEATATGAWQPLDGVFRVALSLGASVHAYVEGPPGQDVAYGLCMPRCSVRQHPPHR